MTDEEIEELINTPEDELPSYSSKHNWVNFGIIMGFAISVLSLLAVGGFVFSVVLLDQTFTEIINENE